MNSIKLWLDDVRPAPAGWHHVKTITEAKSLFEAGVVTHASLDHDLGACETCLAGRTYDEWLASTGYMSAPHCEHFGTGYDLVCWMEETGIWPKEAPPRVHSANPAGAKRMWLAIQREWNQRGQKWTT